MIRIATEVKGSITILKVSGKLTIGNREFTLDDAVHDLLRKGSRQILVDLTETSYVESAGMGQLVAAFKKIRDVGATARLLVKESSRVHGKISETVTESYFDLVLSEADAIASFSD
ncbi:MAG: STAS domain-containing protein [Patescibacteria group bacterium]